MNRLRLETTESSLMDDVERLLPRLLAFRQSGVRLSIDDFGQSLGMSVTAEGVERPEALSPLVSLGCDVVQGYRVSKPLHQVAALHYVAALAASPGDGDATDSTSVATCQASACGSKPPTSEGLMTSK